MSNEQIDRMYFLNYVPQHKSTPVNFLLFGASGMGKSSLINLVLSSVKDGSVVIKAITRSEFNKSVTQTVTYEKYVVAPYINIWDTFGWTQKVNYENNEFGNMLSGKYLNNSHMNTLNAQPTPSVENEIDCVIFVIDYLALDLKEQLLDLKRFYQIAKDRGAVVAIAVTKLDINDEKLQDETNPQIFARQLQRNKRYQEILQFVETLWQDYDTNIFPIVNYPHGDRLKKATHENTVVQLMRYCLDSLGKYSTENVTIDPYPFFEAEKPIFGVFQQ